MTETHVIQIRDLIEELNRYPADAEVSVAIGGTEHFIIGAKPSGERSYKRRVCIDVHGSDRVQEEDSEGNAVELLEHFDKIMSLDKAPSELVSAMATFHSDVSKFLNER